MEENSKINQSLLKVGRSLVFLFAALLPIYEQGSTWLLIATVIFSLYLLITNKKSSFIKYNWLLIAIPSLLLLIRLLGISFEADVDSGLKDVTRGLSYLFIPFAFLIMQHQFGKKAKLLNTVFKGLTVGVFLAVAICWLSILIKLQANHLPITHLFTWKYSNSYLTQVIQIHPPYLGALITGVVLFLFRQYIFRKNLNRKSILVLLSIGVLILFLFHLVARNSILFILIATLGYVLYVRHWKALIVIIFAGMGSGFFIINNGNHYLKRKYYKMLDFSDEKTGDKRFKRLEASYKVFKNNPLTGAGARDVDSLRLIEYKKMNDKQAIIKNFNSHNQYIEYLTTFGIIGITLFIICIGALVFIAISDKNHFLLIILASILFAFLTESFLERELGIKYFSLIAALILSNRAISLNKSSTP